MISDSVNNLGFNIIATFGTGEEALEIVKSGGVDLVLMDIGLEGEWDGIETAEKIKEI